MHQVRFLGTVRARIGWAVDHALFYATGGWAATNAGFTESFGAFGNTVVATANSDTMRSGWTVGVGIEYAFTNNWSAKSRVSLCELRQYYSKHSILHHSAQLEATSRSRTNMPITFFVTA